MGGGVEEADEEDDKNHFYELFHGPLMYLHSTFTYKDVKFLIATVNPRLRLAYHWEVTPSVMNCSTSANSAKPGIPGRNFSGPVSIDKDHKRIPGHIIVCLLVKFFVNHFQ